MYLQIQVQVLLTKTWAAHVWDITSHNIHIYSQLLCLTWKSFGGGLSVTSAVVYDNF